MEFEKHSSKGGGGYVGGFLQLFDWNGKSRKKLFSPRCDLPEGSKIGKRSDGNLPMTRVRLIDDDDNWASSVRGSSDYSCASSVTDDDGSGTRAPGVVARLMGLNSLPTSGVEPYSTPFSDAGSLRDAQNYKRTPVFKCEQKMIHSGSQAPKLEGSSRNSVEPRSQKMQNRPFERFQTEILRPKSAKSIPITHHKLLSPIKSHGFIPTKDAADIMEAASRIIKPQPQGATRGKMPSLGSSSVPLRVRDFKEKMDAARTLSRLPGESRRPVESNAVKYLKEQPLNRSWNGSEDTREFKASPDSVDRSSSGLKNNGRSVSLAIQAKVNVQRREGLRSSRNLQGQKEPYEFKSNQPFKGQLNTQKNMQKRLPTQGATGVLRQNNQKQNSLTSKDKLPTKLSVPNLQGRKTVSGDSSFGWNRKLNKAAGKSRVGSKKTGLLESSNIEKKVPSSRSKSFPQKKRSIEGDSRCERGASVRSFSVDKDETRIESNVGKGGLLKWAEDNRSRGMDIVSFTFTSPMVKSMPGSQLSSQTSGKNNCSGDSCGEENFPVAKNSKLSSLGLNVVGGDALSILLEEKLRELTYGLDSSHRNSVKTQSALTSASITQDLVSAFNSGSMMPMVHDQRYQLGLHKDSYLYNSTYGRMLKMDNTLQVGEDFSVYSSSSRSNIKVREEIDHRHTSPISILESSFSIESYNSSNSGESGDSNSNDGSIQFSSIKAQVVESTCPKKSQFVDPETELSDSASSVFTTLDCSKHAARFTMAADDTRSDRQKLEYMKEILCNADLMFKDFTLGRAREIINPHLFDQLEKTWSRTDAEENDSWLRRKLLFDCARECLDLRCRRYASGGCRTWAKGVALLQRKEWLAEEVYKEISGWESVADWMVDELVDKDMSTQYGRWLEYEIEEFEVGVEIERSILSSLVDEVIADIF